MDKGLGRRSFLGGLAGIGGALALGCEGEGGALDGGVDGFVPGIDAGPPTGLSKPPFVQLLDAGRARLRFETRIDHAVGVVLDVDGAMRRVDPTRSPQILDYTRAALTAEVLPDEPGLHVVHEVLVEGLAPGAEVRWRVEPPDAEPLEGRFRAPVAPGERFRMGWIADTMWPFAQANATRLGMEAPDVVLHGGDITYQTSPLDTWNGMMSALAPIMSVAPMHFILGNHELEDQDEVSVQYERLFGGQGDEGGTARYFAFTYGHVRFICLDTETGRLAEMDAPQLAWLDAELARASADPAIRFPIVSFHRPTYTLSRHAPRDTTVRELLHSRFLAHGVPLVLAGHVHAQERFEVDGITYWIDGGGGAILYDPDQRIEDVEMWRPGEPELRVAANRSNGITVLDFEADEVIVRRLARLDGTVEDETRIATP
jgi:acid phosphatase type 7